MRINLQLPGSPFQRASWMVDKGMRQQFTWHRIPEVTDDPTKLPAALVTSPSFIASDGSNDQDDTDVDPMIADDIDFACHSKFPLLQDGLGTDPVSEHETRTLLSPFQDRTSLEPRLLVALLYVLLPGPTNIVALENAEDASGDLLQPEGDYVRVALLVLGSGDPALVLGGHETEKSYYLGTENTETLGQDMALRLYKDLELVWNLRRRYLNELVRPYRAHKELSRLGIPDCGVVPPANSDARDFPASPVAESAPGSLPFRVPDLDGFDRGSLQQAMLKAYMALGMKKALRILQCVCEIGSEDVLTSLQESLSRPEGLKLQRKTPVVQKLLHIHHFLDKQEIESHIAIARNRYVKYCYFEIFQFAARLVSEAKGRSSKERYKVTLYVLNDVFSVLSTEDRKKPATAMLRQSIANQLGPDSY
ncbi:hypothetical protein K491DRAFT_763655 [Lophiostoma macrostomum CBS 122681]|uniref:Uncharacterized protein n=1 Tax=Lophiostoma macrostomum CBS 122681 TaxID=1314788 RepID=A0A6A6SIT4_9PLEO|nr:hypothetical protein K491DRAFT_763655 [Lophiostoma macrostomum CBS 122681]